MRRRWRRKGSPGQSAKWVCREQGCDKWARAGGLCVAHGGVARQKPCSVEGCDKQPQGGHEGMCKRHFKDIYPCSTSTNPALSSKFKDKLNFVILDIKIRWSMTLQGQYMQMDSAFYIIIV